jgi:mannose-6-phosphate isomerase-like protein (cupin superfamily)
MQLISRKEIKNPLTTPQGEMIFELLGAGELSGGGSRYSLAEIIIPPGKSSALHYHKDSEEVYYILRGEGRMRINQREFSLQPGQACLIKSGEKHQIWNRGESDLEFIAICVPAWTPEDSFELEEE